MNGTNEAKGLWIHYRNKQTEKNTDYFFKNGFFKSFSRQNKVNSSI